MAEQPLTDPKPAIAVEDEILGYLNAEVPASFFLFAGAGSGKTRSLVYVLDRLRAARGRALWLRGQRIGVITYTNAACDEIKRRLEFDPVVEVATIHSFAWSLISSFHGDIREWLRVKLAAQISEIEEKQKKGQARSQAHRDREQEMVSKRKRLADLDTITRFVYSPTGDNRGRDSLNHSEVIEIASNFLTSRPVFSRILVSKFPVLFIDESQDTNRHLMDALIEVQSQHRGSFSMGLFGDTMQRIYADGKPDLPGGLPDGWEKPAKLVNYRSPARIVKLVNQVRSVVDSHVQEATSDKAGGVVRFFLATVQPTVSKGEVEAKIAERMAEITGDQKWVGAEGDVKTLTLEHHMAARRMGFLEIFEPLYAVDSLKTGLLEGSLPGLRLFTADVMPLVEAKQREDEFAAAAIIRNRSPILDRNSLRSAGAEQPQLLKKARDAVDALMSLWRNEATPCLSDILMVVSEHELFHVPEQLQVLAARKAQQDDRDETADPPVAANEVTAAWQQCLNAPYPQVIAYSRYLTGQSPFTTHQNVKGLEFPRVMVVMDDEEARGFLFSYDKLTGAKGKSATDIKNEQEGKETSFDRTRRLFYVTCSRAMESLAIVAYSSVPEVVKAFVLAQGWFEEDEVEVVVLP